MVVDAILYNGERDIFDLRYGVLKDYVDEFVVVEFGTTFSGKPKESHPINLPRVSYHFFTQVKDVGPALPPAFAMEYNQREMIKECLTHLNDDDTVVIGDCDEIWDPHLPAVGMKCRLRVYSYFLNNRSSEEFALGPIVGTYRYVKDMSINELRTHQTLSPEYRGWHFTSMGGVAELKRKIESYGHQEFNTPQVKDGLEYRLSTGQDFVGRNFTYTIDEASWPQFLLENREKYIHLLRPEPIPQQ